MDYHLESLSEGYPFYLAAHKTDADGNKYVLTVNPLDEYRPRVTGVHNVFLSKWSGKEHPNVYQQWVWDAEE
jgi:hypothetical protein